ncbi:MAG: GAF domain-containing sensor histidine kinase [Thermomicrobiales bacterium]
MKTAAFNKRRRRRIPGPSDPLQCGRSARWRSSQRPASFSALFAVDELFLSRLVSPVYAFLLQAGITVVGVGVFTWVVLRSLSQTQDRLRRQHEEMAALHDAGLAINHQLELNAVLQRVTDESRRLTSARYSAIMTEDPATGSLLFVTSGLSVEERRRIGTPPQGKGVLGLAYEERRTIRVENIPGHPASTGVPPHHPEMNSLLSVPLRADDDVVGQLYLVDKENDQPFTDDDEQTVERFSILAALAIRNAQLMEQTEALAIADERNRVAREMHDHIAQVLAYVTTKSDAARELMTSGQNADAFSYISDISRTAREAFSDVREQIVGLRSSSADMQLNIAIPDFAERWSQRTGIATTIEIPEALTSVPHEVQLQVLRIVQEALTNAGKHSGCRQVHISATMFASDLVVTVDDDGVGMHEPGEPMLGGPRFGLAMMRERAHAIGGDVEICPSPSGGSRVQLRAPLDTGLRRAAIS